MEFQLPYYRKFKKHLTEIADRYRLNPDNLKIEFFTPDCQAILIEQVENQNYKIHINLEENRIISIKRISKNGEATTPEYVREKYRQFMK